MKDILLLFIKFPRAGKVKTRLGADIGDENAAFLYKAFVEDMLDSFDKAGLSTMVLYDDSTSLDEYRSWLGARSFSPQQGTDLGERMANAFLTAFGMGYDKAVLTGSDLPGLNPEIIKEGFKNMEKYPACIGPAKDGGYYLIGFRKEHFTDGIFKKIEWSTPEVYRKTIERFSRNRIAPQALPCFTDVDNLDDLESLLRSQDRVELCPRTAALADSILFQKAKQSGILMR